MTAPTLTHLVSAQTVATVTSLSSGSVTITAGRPALAIVFSGGVNSDDNTTAPTFSGAGQTWTQVLSTTDVFADAGYNDYMRVSMFVADASSGGSGALTATHPAGEQQDIVAFAVFELTDGSFASPEPLTKGNNALSMTDALAGVAAGDRYAALCLWTSFYTSSPGAFTARSGWTDIAQVIAPDAGYGLAFQMQFSPVGGDASASFSVTNTGQLALIAIPLESAAAGGTTWFAAAHIVSGSACAGSQRMIRRRVVALTAGSAQTTTLRVTRARAVSAPASSTITASARVSGKQMRGATIGGASGIALSAQVLRRRAASINAQTAVLATSLVSGTVSARVAPSAAALVTVEPRVIRNRAAEAVSMSSAAAQPRAIRKRAAGINASSALLVERQRIVARAANAQAVSVVAVHVWFSGYGKRRDARSPSSENGGAVRISQRSGQVGPHSRSGRLI